VDGRLEVLCHVVFSANTVRQSRFMLTKVMPYSAALSSASTSGSA